MARRPRQPGNTNALYAGHGIGEWYGAVLRNLPVGQRNARGHNPRQFPQEGKWLCPFTVSFPPAAPRRGRLPNFECTKPGGVCSLRSFYSRPNTKGVEVATGFGPLTSTCPYRFVQDGTVFNHIALDVLGAAPGQFSYVKEIGFLQRVASPMLYPERWFGMLGLDAAGEEAAPAPEVDDAAGQPAAIDDPENVGRIDTLLVDANDPSNWCAVELQAVYFSGKAMPPDIAALRGQTAPVGANAPPPLPLPVGLRRPDFRSSGPKRLLPQLQIKVPALRRWGKKMAVVVDAPFFNSLGPMEDAGHISNSDIVWCVVDYGETEEGTIAPLRVCGTVHTTLESAIVGLTAGQPVTKPLFEERIRAKL